MCDSSTYFSLHIRHILPDSRLVNRHLRATFQDCDSSSLKYYPHSVEDISQHCYLNYNTYKWIVIHYLLLI